MIMVHRSCVFSPTMSTFFYIEKERKLTNIAMVSLESEGTTTERPTISWERIDRATVEADRVSAVDASEKVRACAHVALIRSTVQTLEGWWRDYVWIWNVTCFGSVAASMLTGSSLKKLIQFSRCNAGCATLYYFARAYVKATLKYCLFGRTLHVEIVRPRKYRP